MWISRKEERMKNERKTASRRMTNKELSRWVSGGSNREVKFGESDAACIYRNFNYIENQSDLEVPKGFLIRGGDEKWRVPTYEE